MPLDPQDGDQIVSNNPTPTTATQPAPSTQNTPGTVAPAGITPAQVQQNPAQQTAQPSQNGNQSGTVTNQPAPVHPSVQRASVLRSVAEALAGGPRYNVSVDPNTGQTTRTRMPLSSRDIGMAIALEAISGGIAGLAQRGPGAEGRAAAAGFQQVQGQQQQAQALEEQQAQQAFENQSNQLARRASIYETNSRAVLNTAQAEQMGAEAIDKLIDLNRQSGVLDVDPSTLDNGGQPMTQQEISDAMKAGKLSPTDQIGPIAGRVEVTDPDGTKRWEALHLVVLDPNQKVPLTQEQWDRFAAAGVPGFPAGTKIPATGTDIPLRTMQFANEIAGSHYLANQRLDDLRAVLEGTPDASRVPKSIDFTAPGVNAAMQRFQRYISHNADNLADPYLALQQMGANKRDPKTGQMQPNPDAKYVDTVAQAFGGWNTLLAAHNSIDAQKKVADQYAVVDTADKANAILAAPKRFTPDQVQAARNFITLSNAEGERKATQEARARAVANGDDVKAMFQYGRNPITGEQLSLDNAPDSMLVSASGQVIPQDMVSTFKPSAQEKQTADTARQVLAISAGLQQALQQNPNLAGPLSGRSKQAIAKLGFSDAQSQRFLDDLSFLSSAATKMHTGRFSNEILRKMDNIIKPGMNDQQFTGALSSINDVASRYADEDKLTTVADFKRQQATAMSPTPSAGRQVTIPAGAQIGRDSSGRIVGYKLNGQYVPLGGQQ